MAARTHRLGLSPGTALFYRCVGHDDRHGYPTCEQHVDAVARAEPTTNCSRRIDRDAHRPQAVRCRAASQGTTRDQLTGGDGAPGDATLEVAPPIGLFRGG